MQVQFTGEPYKCCPNCKRTDIRPQDMSDPHARPEGQPCYFVRVYRTRYLPEDVVDGEINGRDDNTTEETLDCTPEPWEVEEGITAVDKAVEALSDAYVSEPSSYPWCAGSWYNNVDGSYVTNHYTGEREEPSGHLYGFTPEEEEEIYRKISAK